MLIHLRPRLYSPVKHVALIDMYIEPFGLKLTGGVDLVARRPYRNRYYAVGCRKKGHLAVDGFLIETANPVDALHTTTRWAINADVAVTHEVHYKLLDHDFDAASDSIEVWGACCAELGGWASRMPQNVIPEPMMEVYAPDAERAETEDFLDTESSWIMFRRQTFTMPTIERERLLDPRLNDERTPQLDAAFRLPLLQEESGVP